MAILIVLAIIVVVVVFENLLKSSETKNNINNPAWAKSHRAEAMKYIWANNNSSISLSVQTGHLGTLAYSRQMSSISVADYAGGWDIQVSLKNKSKKVIKEVVIPFIPYNSVGDLAVSSIGNTSTVNCRIVGPISPSETKIIVFEHLWYDIPLAWLETGTILITFMDGTKEEWHSGIENIPQNNYRKNNTVANHSPSHSNAEIKEASRAGKCKHYLTDRSICGNLASDYYYGNCYKNTCPHYLEEDNKPQSSVSNASVYNPTVKANKPLNTGDCKHFSPSLSVCGNLASDNYYCNCRKDDCPDFVMYEGE